MPHIHTEPGQIDYSADTFVVYQNKVLFRFHDKHKMWLAPGGHVELHETPEEAALREVKEETGLEVSLYQGALKQFSNEPDGQKELVAPLFMNVHNINSDHRHIAFIFAASAQTDTICEPEGYEKSGGCVWLTKEEIVAHPDIQESMKNYALKALELVGDWHTHN